MTTITYSNDNDSKLTQASRVSSGKHILNFLVQVSSIKLKMIMKKKKIRIQVMVVEGIRERMSGMMPRSKI
jgi:hypothetical protein